MRRAVKKEINLNKLKTGCSPCLNEANKMKQRISSRKVSDLKIEEIKVIVSSMFNKKMTKYNVWFFTSTIIATIVFTYSNCFF